MKLRLFIYKIYPVAIPLYLIPISLFYIQFNNSLIIALFGIIPLFFRHPDPVLLFKEIFRNIGIGNKIKSIDGEFFNYKKIIEEILKEHNINFDVKIIDDENINMYAGKSTIYVTKGFLKFVPLNDIQNKLKILPILGHEITHHKRQKKIILEIFICVIALVCLIYLINIIYSILFGFNLFIFWYLTFLLAYLLLFYTFRREEFEADKGGFKFAGNNNIWFIEFLTNIDVRNNKSYNLWDKYDELFSFHPNPINRIRKLEKMTDV